MLVDHLSEVGDLCGQLSAKMGLEKEGELIGLVHDFGKFSGAFQNYIGSATGVWWFSVVDIVQVLTQQPNYQTARNYWKVLKSRLKSEGSEVVTNCNRLRMLAPDGKLRQTDAATAETLLRLVQSVLSPRAEQTLAGQGGL